MIAEKDQEPEKIAPVYSQIQSLERYYSEV